MDQLTMPLSRNTDPATSKAAADAIPAGVVEREIRAVFIKRFSTVANGNECGLTDDALCRLLPHLHGPTVKSARSRLSRAGLLVNSGRTAKSNRGRASIIWKLA